MPYNSRYIIINYSNNNSKIPKVLCNTKSFMLSSKPSSQECQIVDTPTE